MTRRRFLATAASAAGALMGASVAGAYRFQLERLRLGVAGLSAPARVAFLCDLHFGPYIHAASVRSWVDAACAAAPDLIVLGGDLVDDHGGGRTSALLDALAGLEAPLGVFAVWGNHDHGRFRDLSPFRTALARQGIEVLVNQGVQARPDLFLAGVDDVRAGAPDLAAALRERPGHGACLLVSHNPDLLPEVPAAAVDLTLCGHTHGGQVCLPGYGALLTSSRYGRRFAQGWVRGPALGYVSRGLGVGLLPIRVACPAELTVVDLVPLADAARRVEVAQAAQQEVRDA